MKKGNLLIVDDEVLIVNNLIITLEDYAENVFTANNGLEALEVLEKNEIHCVISDINMPKMNGVALIKSIRERQNDVPVVFYTGHGNQDLMIEASKYGAFDFLDKPNLDGLEEVIKFGLAKGFDRQAEKSETGAFESEYAQMLKSLDNI